MGKLKVGVFGVGRGIDIAQNFKLLNCEIVAMCDERKDRMDEAIKKMNDSFMAQMAVNLIFLAVLKPIMLPQKSNL